MLQNNKKVLFQLFINAKLSHKTATKMENSSAVKTSCFHSFSRLFKPAQIINSNNVNDDKMELYIKAGPEDGEVGDCPFAHYVRCVLNYKGLECEVKPCKQESKPDWLLSDAALGGKMPCLRKGDFKMVESGAIVEHLEKTHPEPTLTSVDKEAMAAALEVQSSFFPALAKFIKTVDFDADLEQNLLAQAQKLNDHLAKEGNTYMAGKNQKPFSKIQILKILFYREIFDPGRLLAGAKAVSHGGDAQEVPAEHVGQGYDDARPEALHDPDVHGEGVRVEQVPRGHRDLGLVGSPAKISAFCDNLDCQNILSNG